MRSSHGQASVDYVAVLALVAVVLGAVAATVGAPWLAPKVAETIRRGICVVSGALCTPEDAERAGLEPCPIHRRSNAERAGATIAVIRLERGDELVIERLSNDQARVSFIDGGRAGGEVGLGARLPDAAASVTAGLGVTFQKGRRYDFGSWDEARAFVERFARTETLTGEIREALRDLCRRCPAAIRGEKIRPPKPTATFLEGGAYAELRGEFGADVPISSTLVPAKVEGMLSGAAILGRRREGPRTTTYLKLAAGTVGELGGVIAAVSGDGAAEGVLEVSSEGGRVVEARVRASGAYAWEGTLDGTSLDLADVADRLADRADRPREPGDLGGLAIEGSVALDLTDPVNARAVEGLLTPEVSPQGWIERVRALGRRLEVAGQVDLDVYRTAEETAGHELGVSAGLRAQAGYTRTEQIRDLVAAWSLAAGGQLRRRGDCEEAAVQLAAGS